MEKQVYDKIGPAVPGAQGDQTKEKGQFGDRDLSTGSGVPFADSVRQGSEISAASRAAAAPAPRATPQEVLEGGIRQAFFGKTDGINDAMWADVRAALPTMPLPEARRIWQTIANEVAVDCFDATGHVDVERLIRWMTFLGNTENFRREPFCLIPHAELMRSQMYRTCECLVLNKNGARNLLNTAAGITVETHGQSILATMSQGRQPPLCSYEAILASLFTPIRQYGLPACTIYAIINAEIRDHLERLIAMYIQMLKGSQFTFPSGYASDQQPLVNCSITVNLKNGGEGRAAVFEDITGGDPAKRTQRIARWRQEGIEYVESTDEAEKYKLRLPVHNMNDVLFAHFVQASNFGNWKIDHNSNYGTLQIYAGHKKFGRTYQLALDLNGSKFGDGMNNLQEVAEERQRLGHRFMPVATLFSGGGHLENIDIDALVALNPASMETGRAYPIGDRNWCGFDTAQDIPRLAIRLDNGGLELGTLIGDTRFLETDISNVYVCTTDIEIHEESEPPATTYDYIHRDFFEKIMPTFKKRTTRPLTRQAIEDAFRRDEGSMQKFCQYYLPMSVKPLSDAIHSLTPTDRESLKNDILAAFDKHTKSVAMCDGFCVKFEEKLPELMTDQANPLTRQKLGDIFLGEDNLRSFSQRLGLPDNSADITFTDTIWLRRDMLAAFDRYMLLCPFKERLPQLVVAQPNPLTKQAIEAALKDNATLQRFAANILSLQAFEANNLILADIQKLKNDMLSTFDRYMLSKAFKEGLPQAKNQFQRKSIETLLQNKGTLQRFARILLKSQDFEVNLTSADMEGLRKDMLSTFDEHVNLDRQ